MSTHFSALSVPVAKIASGSVRFRYEKAALNWLLNTFEEDTWRLRAHMNGNPASAMTVSWTPIFADGPGRLHWVYWKNFGKRIAFWLMEHEQAPAVKTSTLAVYCREIRIICEWFCFERRVSRVASVCKDDIEALFDYLEALSLSRGTIETRLAVVRKMHEFKDLVGEGILFDPFRRYGSLRGAAKKLGRDPGHTPTIYPNDFFLVLNEALGVVADSDTVLTRMFRYMVLRGTDPTRNKKKVSRQYKKLYGESSGAVIDDARTLYGACIIVLLSLLGERKHELLNATAEDVSMLLEAAGDEISGVEHKTSGTLTGKKTQRAAIKEVRQSLQTVLQLTQWTREEEASGWFFLRLPFANTARRNPTKELTTLPLYSFIDRFAKNAGVEMKLRPHMFRRAFSLLWAWRYEVGDLSMLSKLLYHNNEVFTRVYTEDEDIWEFMPDAERALAFSILHNSLTGSRRLTGGLGATLDRYQRRLTAKIDVLSPDKAERYANRLLDNGGYRVVPNADGYCFINEARGHRAKCSTDGATPNYANRSEELCFKCPNFGVDESRADYWRKRLEAHRQVLNSTSVEMLAKASREGVERAEKVLSQIQVKEVD